MWNVDQDACINMVNVSHVHIHSNEHLILAVLLTGAPSTTMMGVLYVLTHINKEKVSVS